MNFVSRPCHLCVLALLLFLYRVFVLRVSFPSLLFFIVGVSSEQSLPSLSRTLSHTFKHSLLSRLAPTISGLLALIEGRVTPDIAAATAALQPLVLAASSSSSAGDDYKAAFQGAVCTRFDCVSVLLVMAVGAFLSCTLLRCTCF